MRFNIVILVFSIAVLLALPVSANGGPSSPLSLPTFLLILFGVVAVVSGFLYWLHRTQSQPGTLPIKQLSIAAAATIAINALIFGLLYVEL